MLLEAALYLLDGTARLAGLYGSEVYLTCCRRLSACRTEDQIVLDGLGLSRDGRVAEEVGIV